MKIIKKVTIVLGFLLLLVLTTIGVFADTQVGIDVSTTEDMYADIGLNAGGDIYTNIWFDEGNKHIYMNGVDINYKDPSDSSGLTRNVVFRDIYAGIFGINNGKIFLETALNDKAKNIGRLLYSTFWTRIEQYKYQQAMDVRIRAIELTLDQIAPDEFCENKKDLMHIYNMSSVPCGNEIHYRNGMITSDVIPSNRKEYSWEETTVNNTGDN